MHPKRARKLNNATDQKGPIMYWMDRDERMHDNWALIFAQKWAREKNEPFGVVFNFIPDFLGGGLRQFDFKIKGLQKLEKSLKEKNIPFFLITHEQNKGVDKLIAFLAFHKVSGLVTDFSPLRIQRQWKNDVLKKITIPFYEVDAHNIVPCWTASPKQEFGAYTLRPKIHKLLPEFLEEYESIKKQKKAWPSKITPINFEKIKATTKVNINIAPVKWVESGEDAALKTLKNFLHADFQNYAENRNNPNKNVQSNLSPYLHYGQLSAQRIALEIQKHFPHDKNTEVFLEELIVRRELADNYCFYNQNYDNFNGFPNWAQQTLNEHRGDPRDHLYTQEEFEYGKTHDDLWNAAQLEMIETGKMHGYMRMYWAKKILEWTTSPEEAQKIAIYLNDTYELDGRDPNGYTGIAWSIGGVHDRAWFSRPIFGKIRYMSYNGCKSKFDIKTYISTFIK